MTAKIDDAYKKPYADRLNAKIIPKTKLTVEEIDHERYMYAWHDLAQHAAQKSVLNPSNQGAFEYYNVMNKDESSKSGNAVGNYILYNTADEFKNAKIFANNSFKDLTKEALFKDSNLSQKEKDALYEDWNLGIKKTQDALDQFNTKRAFSFLFRESTKHRELREAATSYQSALEAYKNTPESSREREKARDDLLRASKKMKDKAETYTNSKNPWTTSGARRWNGAQKLLDIAEKMEKRLEEEISSEKDDARDIERAAQNRISANDLAERLSGGNAKKNNAEIKHDKYKSTNNVKQAEMNEPVLS